MAPIFAISYSTALYNDSGGFCISVTRKKLKKHSPNSQIFPGTKNIPVPVYVNQIKLNLGTASRPLCFQHFWTRHCIR